ncbi:hypothetical protein [Thermus oshimai]
MAGKLPKPTPSHVHQYLSMTHGKLLGLRQGPIVSLPQHALRPHFAEQRFNPGKAGHNRYKKRKGARVVRIKNPFLHFLTVDLRKLKILPKHPGTKAFQKGKVWLREPVSDLANATTQEKRHDVKRTALLSLEDERDGEAKIDGTVQHLL